MIHATLFGNRLEPLNARRTVAAEPAGLAEEFLEMYLPVFNARVEPGHDAGYLRLESRLARSTEPRRLVHELGLLLSKVLRSFYDRFNPFTMTLHVLHPSGDSSRITHVFLTWLVPTVSRGLSFFLQVKKGLLNVFVSPLTSKLMVAP